MIRRFGITQRLLFIVFLFLFLILVTTSLTLIGFNKMKVHSSEVIQNHLLELQKSKIKATVHSISHSLGALIKDIPAENQEEVLRNAIDNIRFETDSSGYFYIYKGTVNVALPIKKEAVGKDLAQNKDVNGVYFVQELNKQAHAGGGFVEYVFPKPHKGD